MHLRNGSSHGQKQFVIAHELGQVPSSSSSLPSMKSPKRKRIPDAKAGVLIVEQVKPAMLKGTAVRFDLSKGKGVK